MNSPVMSSFTTPRILIFQAISLVSVLSSLTAGGFWLYKEHERAEELLAQLAPRYARLAGLIQGKDKLQQSNEAVRALLLQYAYPATQDAAQAGNDAQQRIRSLFAGTGMEVGSIQVLPPKELKQFDRIGVVLRVEGDIIGLHNALAALEAQRPTVWVDSLAVQTIGAVKPKSPVRLGAQLSLSVLRSRT